MAQLKSKEIAEKTIEELRKILAEKSVKLREFRFGISGSKVRNVKEGLGIRREIARILTKMNQK